MAFFRASPESMGPGSKGESGSELELWWPDVISRLYKIVSQIDIAEGSNGSILDPTHIGGLENRCLS
jgi:hypothetical protein